MFKIIEDGVELELNNSFLDKLLDADIIYHCDDCGFYHTNDSYSLTDVENFIAN